MERSQGCGRLLRFADLILHGDVFGDLVNRVNQMQV